jgi:two-component system phosphate regulon sensor histidine kinase PhoR
MVDWIKNRREFVNRVIAGMFYKSADIEKRISPEVLEQIIHDVIKENGIDLHYEYAVIRANNEIAFSSRNYSPAEEAEYYKVQLFPEDVIANANSLSIYFPAKQNFLFKSLSYLAISSLLLTLAIVTIFGVTIVVMHRQKRLSEIRNDFVSNMTHELKTPISTISLASQMLGDKSIPPEIKNTEQISKIIAEECRRLGNQVEKVLQTAVFDKGKLKLRLVEADMHEVISSVIENFSIQVKNRNGKISSVLNAENFILLVDQVHITNVLSNLLDNAIKYCDRDPEILIETSNRGEFFLILVKDNGIGISKADQKRVFEKFYRVPTGNVHTVKGFGLGLSYVKMIIEEHHGYVDLESELYSGSTFKIYLPLGDHGEHAKDKNSAG